MNVPLPPRPEPNQDWMETAAPANKLRLRHNCRNDLYSAASVHFSADGVHWPAAAATSQEALDVNCGRRRAPASLLAPCGLVAFAPSGSMVPHSVGSAGAGAGHCRPLFLRQSAAVRATLSFTRHGDVPTLRVCRLAAYALAASACAGLWRIAKEGTASPLSYHAGVASARQRTRRYDMDRVALPLHA